MKKFLKYSALVIVSLGLVIGIGAVWLYQAGQDDSPSAAAKVPPQAQAAQLPALEIDLSPALWDEETLNAYFERNEKMGDADILAVGENGVIAATTGAPAILAGLRALEQGGGAIDALLTTSLAQIALASGCWVSYGGIFELVYYDAASGEVYNLNAGYNTFLGEDDPASIPAAQDADGNSTPSGRTAMVPGYFAGVQAAHDHFGRLPFSALFEPAIYITEQGFLLSSFLERAIEMRKDVLTRLPETRAVFTKEDGSLYKAGDHFTQPAVATTLKAVAEQGADYIYKGPWAEKFVAAVQAEGGKVTMEDMTRYEAIWQEPLEFTFGDYTLFMHGRPGQGGTHLAESLNLAKISKLAEMGDYRGSPEAFFWFSQFTHTFGVSFIPSALKGTLFFGLDTGMANRATQEYAEELWEEMQEDDFFFTTAPSKDPKHSDAIVVIDQWGNIAAVTHTINTGAWGGTGIFVDGVSIPDSASFQQAQLAELQPGDRVPDPTEPLIMFKNGKPYGAFSSIGAGLHQKTFTVLLNIMAYGSSLQEAMGAPSTHIPAFDAENLMEPPAVQVAKGEFSAELLAAVREMGLKVVEFGNTLEERAPRGYVVGAVINETGEYEAMGPRLFNGPAEAY